MWKWERTRKKAKSVEFPAQKKTKAVLVLAKQKKIFCNTKVQMLYRVLWAHSSTADQLTRLQAHEVDFLQESTSGEWGIHPPHGRRNSGEKGGLSASRSDTRNGALLRADLPPDFSLGDKLPGFVRIGGQRYHQLLLFESNDADWSESWVVHDDGNSEDNGHVVLYPRRTTESESASSAFDVENPHCEDIDEMQADGSIVSRCSFICKSAQSKVLVERQSAGIWRLCGIALRKRPAPLWGYFYGWHDLTLQSVVYALRLAETHDCADYALSALWATDTLFRLITLYYDCYDLVDGHVRAINGNAVLYSGLDNNVTEAAYLVNIICRCLQAVEADDKEIDRSIAARIAILVVRGWLLPIPTDSDADTDLSTSVDTTVNTEGVAYMDTARIRVRHEVETNKTF